MKADCEGNEGPQTFNKTEADGANMLARALVTALHHGTQVVMWRAFIYGGDTSNAHEEKAKQEYDTIHPLDGKFDSNVIVQVRHTLYHCKTQNCAHCMQSEILSCVRC